MLIKMDKLQKIGTFLFIRVEPYIYKRLEILELYALEHDNFGVCFETYHNDHNNINCKLEAKKEALQNTQFVNFALAHMIMHLEQRFLSFYNSLRCKHTII